MKWHPVTQDPPNILASYLVVLQNNAVTEMTFLGEYGRWIKHGFKDIPAPNNPVILWANMPKPPKSANPLTHKMK